MLSIIIPTYDRPGRLKQCLEGLTRLAVPTDQLEVIVVDDGSRTPAASIVAPFAARLPIRSVRQDNSGPASARNAGSRLARGEWLVFLDDDCIVADDWWGKLEIHRTRHAGAMIGGATRNQLDGNPYAACHQLLLDYLYHHFNRQPDAAVFCASNNLAVPAADFHALGGFDTGFRFAAGEDRDLCDRWRSSGRQIVHAKDLLVHHTNRMTLRSFWRQHYRYGRGASRYHRRQLERSVPTTLQPAGFYLGLLLFPLRRVRARQWPTAISLLLLTQLATACGYASERWHTSQHSS